MAMGDQLLFQAVDPGGTALWASDGTAAGTTELKFLSASTPPNSTGYPASSLDDDGIIYFAADDGTHGTELWQSDGTSAGTFLVADINPGAASSDPTPLAVVNGQVVLAANDGTHGDELMEVASTSQTAAPQLATVPTQQATAGETFQLPLDLYASDPNEPVLPLTYSLGTDAPAGMTIDASTGLVTWPGSSDQTTGPYSFTVTVSDNSSPALTASGTITVERQHPAAAGVLVDPGAGRHGGPDPEPRRQPVRHGRQLPALAVDLQPGREPAVGRLDHSGRPADLGDPLDHGPRGLLGPGHRHRRRHAATECGHHDYRGRGGGRAPIDRLDPRGVRETRPDLLPRSEPVRHGSELAGLAADLHPNRRTARGQHQPDDRALHLGDARESGRSGS